MFLIFGISNGEKKLDFVQTMLCSHCGKYGRLELYMSYMYFSLFFIPIFKWSRKYYVKSTCCNMMYEIDYELGKRLQRGEQITLTENDLHAMNHGGYATRYCRNCGYPSSPEFDYCPKCGSKL
ncbi:MAG TPA: zinc ribbon domain-containing protein [Mobilitalea sp.]|nr:zinc ribbon domain-containing protein [Mobilitalea sp.]